MLIRSIFLSAVVIAFHSCGNNQENNNSNGTDSLKTDSVPTANASLAPSSAIKADELLGAWMAVEGDCYAEEINLEPEGAFSSYLHAKPFSDGRWSLDNDKLIIKLKDNTELKYSARMDDSKMVLTLTDEAGKVSVYEAIVGC